MPYLYEPKITESMRWWWEFTTQTLAFVISCCNCFTFEAHISLKISPSWSEWHREAALQQNVALPESRYRENSLLAFEMTDPCWQISSHGSLKSRRWLWRGQPGRRIICALYSSGYESSDVPGLSAEPSPCNPTPDAAPRLPERLQKAPRLDKAVCERRKTLSEGSLMEPHHIWRELLIRTENTVHIL